MIDLEELPWCAFVGSSGLTRQALDRRSDRDHRQAPDSGVFGPEREWERAALVLEADIWAARHCQVADTTTLRERADQLLRACHNDEHVQISRWRT
ncbi:hypothetical protein Dvina_19480 [Dactylosporangium vinaceum]|uniref:Uncharacterized protein n=1 Tax=Dactylosporangium vinaceum TaxID=53362 RepID=A0ABV5M9I7_9ACTN|nr:hypothetical protein [Dactylosporangium vinaceum]UAC00043.1 hypothetical protein Dvina_19480 [Dactylosporangium vinaceum]